MPAVKRPQMLTQLVLALREITPVDTGFLLRNNRARTNSFSFYL
jgi:hypothetical protein